MDIITGNKKVYILALIVRLCMGVMAKNNIHDQFSLSNNFDYIVR